MLADDRDRVVAEERWAAGQHLVEHRAERVEVAARVGIPADRLLGRHVDGGPDHHPGHGETRAIDRDGEAEVAELGRAVGGEPDVSRLHIAVHDAAPVRVGERLTDLLGDPDRLRDREATFRGAGQKTLDVAAGHVLADDIGFPVLFTDVEDGDDVRMIAEARHGLRLALAAEAPDLVQALGLDHGKRHLPVEARVVREVDALLPALAEEAADGVAATGKAVGRVQVDIPQMSGAISRPGERIARVGLGSQAMPGSAV